MRTTSKILNFLQYLSGPIAVILLVYVVFFNSRPNKKIGFVRSNDLIYGYAGMKEAEDVFSKHISKDKSVVDSLSLELERDLVSFSDKKNMFSTDVAMLMEDSLRNRQIQLNTYSNAVSQNARMEEEKMLEGVLNQVNSFVRKYGEENGFAMVYGTTSDGNILYGEAELDITDDLLTKLNHEYYGTNPE